MSNADIVLKWLLAVCFNIFIILFFISVQLRMTDEKPVPVKKLKRLADSEAEGLTCIIHYTKQSHDQEVRKLTDISFQAIQHAVTVRQSQITESVRLDEICATVPSSYDTNSHGYHVWCYSNFTNVSWLKVQADSAESQTYVSNAGSRTSSRSASSSESQNRLFPQDECLFCPIVRKTRHGKVEPLSRCETEIGEASIKEAARAKKDFVMLGKIEGVDLRAKEARHLKGHQEIQRS